MASSWLNPESLPDTPPSWDLSRIVPEFAGLEASPDALKAQYDTLIDQLKSDMQALQPLVDDLNHRAARGQKLTAEAVLAPITAKKTLHEQGQRYQIYFHLLGREHFADASYQDLNSHVLDRLDEALHVGGMAMRSFQLPSSCVNDLVQQDPSIERYRTMLEGDLRQRNTYTPPSVQSAQQEKIDPRNVNTTQLFRAVNASQELAADPQSHQDALTLLVNSKLYQEWRKADRKGKSPDAIAAEANGLPDDFLQKLFAATPMLVDQAAYAAAAQEAKDALGIQRKLDAEPYARQFTWKEAAELVTEAFGSFHPEMGEIAARAFTDGWIDGRNTPEKLHTNFNFYEQTSKSYPDLHPYVSVHFDGSLKSVRALAHELGHAVADYLSGVESGESIEGGALHETFAHFGEALMMEHLVATSENPQDKAALRMVQFERAIQAIVQTGSGTLESELYKATQKEDGEIPTLSSQEIATIMRNAMKVALSDSVLEKFSDFDLLKNLGRNSQMLQHEPFNNASYPLAEMAAMHMIEEYRGLDGADKEAYANHWVKTMKLGSMLNYGRSMDAMGMDITEPEALVAETKETLKARMAESVRHLADTSRDLPGFAARAVASREAGAGRER